MDDYLNDGETFDDYIIRTQREIEIHILNMDYHLSGMDHARRQGGKFLYLQFALGALALICVALGYTYGGHWLLASIPFSLGSLGPAFVYCTYMKEFRAESRAFGALETPAVLKQMRYEMEEAEKAKRKDRWWRRLRRLRRPR
ncbi:hypothetical protein [Rhodococcus opacus]|uniref:hypothetical protein n=1 Tax=Rhodococcus opacus TaxID=37919 RepID=UPI001C4641B2|nr:hypothetical protein [Rhodococcus opacus]MBV6759527.1 hypothetical protein [Rhodococcus opacus]